MGQFGLLKHLRHRSHTPHQASKTLSLVWRGLVWSGLVWSGVGWSGLAWAALERKLGRMSAQPGPAGPADPPFPAKVVS